MMITQTRAVRRTSSSHTIIAISHPPKMPRSSVVAKPARVASSPRAVNASVLRLSNASVFASTSARVRAGEVRQQHDHQEPRDVAQRPSVASRKQRQNHRQRVLGEELLAAEDDDEKAEAVAEVDDQRTPLGVRQMRAQQGHADERKTHRKSGRETGPRQRGSRPLQFIRAFFTDCVIDDGAARGRSLFRLFFALFVAHPGSGVCKKRPPFAVGATIALREMERKTGGAKRAIHDRKPAAHERVHPSPVVRRETKQTSIEAGTRRRNRPVRAAEPLRAGQPDQARSRPGVDRHGEERRLRVLVRVYAA